MGEEKKPASKVDVRVISPTTDAFKTPTVFIAKSDKSEQLDPSVQISAAEWIQHPVDMRGLKALVDNSTILPQCIRAYKNNIAGFGISVEYTEDYEKETTEMKEEWDRLAAIIDLLNMDMQAKEVFESIIQDRETYGISYCEVIRNMKGEAVGLDFIEDTPSVEMTYPLEPYIDTVYCYKGNNVQRKKKFRKFRQTVAGKTVYFKEFGDPRVMDKHTGEYLGSTEEPIQKDDEANEIIEFRIGNMPYGEVRWIGQVLTIDGSRRAEVLNNNYFRKGRHTPLMILIKGGTLTDDAYKKLQAYMNNIEGESGQHSFLLLETDTNETTAGFEEQKQPEVEIKDLANILQKDELFQEYQENGRKKVQSAFLLPDLYTGYTTDFNRATSQTAMEVTEKQVFQPERESLAWAVNNRLLNAYNFRFVRVKFDKPDMTNPDDIQKILNITERAGGLTPNMAKSYTYEVLGLDGCEDYPKEWGDIPLAYSKTLTQGQLQEAYEGEPVGNSLKAQNALSGQIQSIEGQSSGISEGELAGIDTQIQKAALEDAELVPVMKEIRKALAAYKGESR